MITKSVYLKGRQCLKRQWFAVQGIQEPEIEPDEVWEERLREGAHVEGHAEQLFPEGVHISLPIDDDDSSPPSWRERLQSTREALRGDAPVFQAHLEFDDLFAVADILEPRGGGWFLWEVKASTRKAGEWKPVFDWDLAFQVLLARRTGLRVVGSGVILLSRNFVLESEEVDPHQLLVREDRSDVVEGLLPQVEAELASMREALDRETAPVELPGSRCKGYREAKHGNRVSDCGHLSAEGYCGRALPENWAGCLPNLRGNKRTKVDSTPNLDIESLDPDDDDWSWTDAQRWAIQAVKTGAAQVEAPAIRAALDAIEWPVAYVDFEFDPGVAVPRFRGCRPYDRLPFQWALVVQAAPGSPLGEPQAFLHLDDTDPSRPFAETLLEALPGTGSLVAHYATAETSVLRRLAERLGGGTGAALEALRPRFADTQKIAKAGYYHPAQMGSWSIKKLAPALVGRGYDDLEIGNGMAAVMAWRRAVVAEGADRERLRDDLLRYCGRDAELMHGILEALRELVGDR